MASVISLLVQFGLVFLGLLVVFLLWPPVLLIAKVREACALVWVIHSPLLLSAGISQEVFCGRGGIAGGSVVVEQ